MVDDPVGNVSAYYNLKEKQKHHQSRLPVSEWHYAKKIGWENDSHNRENARSTCHTILGHLGCDELTV